MLVPLGMLSKLLGTPFGVSLQTADVDQFYRSEDNNRTQVLVIAPFVASPARCRGKFHASLYTLIFFKYLGRVLPRS